MYLSLQDAMKTAKTSSKKVSRAPLSHGVGRRKSAVARVWLRPGKGIIKVNGKEAATYFDTDYNRTIIGIPFKVCAKSTYDVDANVVGGGTTAQAGAVSLGIARALLISDEALRPTLKQHHLLTVDSRVKERKKYGQKAARRKFQFVKR
jgi:small subunit ribosomal protein S9